MIGLVVYALAQFATLRRIQEEEAEAELQVQEALRLRNQNQPFLSPPSTAITPPTPQNGTIPKLPQANSTKNGTGTKLLSKTSMWLPSVGALQLSESSILKRRASLKRKRSLQGQRNR